MARKVRSKTAVVVTCEHGGNNVPRTYRSLFADHAKLLATHRGYDPGALELAKRFAKQLAAPLHFGTTTRLLVELNRTIGNKTHFSAITRELSDDVKRQIIAEHYEPYRSAVEQTIAQAVRQAGFVLHLSVHSFTPVFDGDVRRADVGLLYDPTKASEKKITGQWIDELKVLMPDLVVRRNYPYLGRGDGFTTYLRKKYAPSRYAGIELEVNQRYPLAGGKEWRELQRTLTDSLQTVVQKSV